MNENIAPPFLLYCCLLRFRADPASHWQSSLPFIPGALYPPQPESNMLYIGQDMEITNSASLSIQDGSEEDIKIPKQGKSKRLVLLPLSLAFLHMPAPCSVWSSAWFYLVFSVASLSQSSASYFLPLLSPKERWILNKFPSLSTTSFLVVCFGFCT